jgi:hypothetical protein
MHHICPNIRQLWILGSSLFPTWVFRGGGNWENLGNIIMVIAWSFTNADTKLKIIHITELIECVNMINWCNVAFHSTYSTWKCVRPCLKGDPCFCVQLFPKNLALYRGLYWNEILVIISNWWLCLKKFKYHVSLPIGCDRCAGDSGSCRLRTFNCTEC